MENRKTAEALLAERYAPALRFDRAEPFYPAAVGYTVFTEDFACRAVFRSPSSRLLLETDPGETVIEYAFYYDFDIQHLYDLEHVFVRLDREGGIKGVLGSFHGKFLDNFIEGETRFEDTHVILYVQPGKHAFMPLPHYFRLAPDRDRCCGEYAGREGLLIAPMFEGRLSTDEAFDRKAERYIRENHAFAPTWEFTARAGGALMPWTELEGLIVERVTAWKHKIERAAEGPGTEA